MRITRERAQALRTVAGNIEVAIPSHLFPESTKPAMSVAHYVSRRHWLQDATIDVASFSYLFLDIDGVLNSTRSAVALGSSHLRKPNLDPVSVELVRKAVQLTKSLVVISSTWRIGADLREFDFLDLPIVGFTPCLEVATRGDEVREFVEQHGLKHYVCLDDDDDFYPGQNLVCTNRAVGVTVQNFNDLILILGETA